MCSVFHPRAFRRLIFVALVAADFLSAPFTYNRFFLVFCFFCPPDARDAPPVSFLWRLVASLDPDGGAAGDDAVAALEIACVATLHGG
jgi:hypothetical protein